ncbi:hypothetical protein Tco_0021268, partial [Tanacetum coccineum]
DVEKVYEQVQVFIEERGWDFGELGLWEFGGKIGCGG